MLHQQKVPKSAIICVFATLQNCSHTICTAYGDSDTMYGGCFWVVQVQDGPGPVHGLLIQGNGKGPALWKMISSLMLIKDQPSEQ
jgi:hypothetical protein